MRKLKSLINERFYPQIIIALIFIVYSRIIFTEKLVDIDYNIVIRPLKSLSFFSSYWNKFLSPEIYDVQPVRDFTLFIDLWVEQIISFQAHGFFNVLYWSVACLFLYRLLIKLVSSNDAFILSLCMSVHPTLAWSLGWPTARKHILATMFISMFALKAYEFLFENKDTRRLIILCFTLSVFSQPITLFYGVLFMGLCLYKKCFDKTLMFGIALIGLFCAGLNHYYYDSVYIIQAGTAKYAQMGDKEFPLRIVAVSRYFTQLLIPWSIANTYSLKSILNFIGLPVFCIFIYLSFLRVNHRNIMLLLIALIVAPIVVTNLKLTNIFVSDTYLLASILFLGVLLAMARTPTFLIGSILFISMSKNIWEQKLSTQAEGFFRAGFEREMNCKNTLAYGHYLLEVLDFENFLPVAEISVRNKCLITGVVPGIISEQIYATYIFIKNDLSKTKKVEHLVSFGSKNPRIIEMINYLKSSNPSGFKFQNNFVLEAVSATESFQK